MGSKFLAKDWEEYRTKINERLNKIVYLEPTMKFKTFSEIEHYIIKEWRKNYVFVILNALWFKSLIKYNFENPEDFES